MKDSYKTLKIELIDNIVRVTFNREKDTNSFSREMTLELMEVCRHIQEDGLSDEPKYGALILTGGTDRSFSVGGDFCLKYSEPCQHVSHQEKHGAQFNHRRSAHLVGHPSYW